jgi:hypothetical protein
MTKPTLMTSTVPGEQQQTAPMTPKRFLIQNIPPYTRKGIRRKTVMDSLAAADSPAISPPLGDAKTNMQSFDEKHDKLLQQLRQIPLNERLSKEEREELIGETIAKLNKNHKRYESAGFLLKCVWRAAMTLAVVYIIFRETKGSGALRKSRSFEDECKGDVKTFASFMEKRAGGLKEKVLHVPIVGSAIFAAYSLLLPYFPMLSPVLGALPRVLLWIRGLQRWVVIPTNVAVFATNAIRKFAPVVRAVRFWPSVVAGAQRGAQAAVAFCSRVAVVLPKIS